MSTSPELLRGAAAAVPAARLDADLRTTPWASASPLSRYGVDPRLVDPRLEPAFADVLAEAEAAARALGLARGLAEGRAAAAAELDHLAGGLQRDAEDAVAHERRVLAGAVDALRLAVEQWSDRDLPTINEHERAAGELAVEVARMLCGAVPDAVVHAARTAVASVGRDRGEVTLRVHPDDVGVLGAPEGARVVADSTVGRGGCVAEAGGRRADARRETALARLAEELGA